MTEIAHLEIGITADVADALNAMRAIRRETQDATHAVSESLKGVDTEAVKMGNTAARESEKVEGFMGKWKMGWVAMGAAAITSLYAVAKSSAVMRSYFSEFGGIVGDVFDEIGIAMSPIIDPLLDFLWDLERAFVKKVVPAIGEFATKVAEIAIPALRDLKDAFMGLPKEAKIPAIGIGTAAIGLAPIVAPFAAIPVMILAIFRDKLPKIKDVFMEVWSDIKSTYETFVKPIFEAMGTFIGAVWDTIKLEIAAAILAVKAILTGDTKLLRDVWEKFGSRLREVWGFAWSEIKAIVGPALTSIISKMSEGIPRFIEAGREIPSAIITGIGDLGSKIWNAIRDGLSYVSTQITDWASGVLGFSPTLREIGAMIPKTIMEAAGMGRITAPPVSMDSLTKPSSYILTPAPTPIIERTTTKENKYYITAPITITSGLSSDHEFRELARKLKGHLMRELRTLG